MGITYGTSSAGWRSLSRGIVEAFHIQGSGTLRGPTIAEKSPACRAKPVCGCHSPAAHVVKARRSQPLVADTRSNGIGEAVYALQKSGIISPSPSTRGPKMSTSRPSGPASNDRAVPGLTRTASSCVRSTMSSSSLTRPEPARTT